MKEELMNFILKLIDMIGGFEGIRKVFDGKKTYLSCSAIVLGGTFWIVWTLYLFGQKQVDANTAYVQITVCAAAIGDAIKSIFARMATAKHDALLKAVQQAQTIQSGGHANGSNTNNNQ
jgi:hypothetical protein